MNQAEQSDLWGGVSPLRYWRGVVVRKKIGLARGSMKKLMAGLWSGLGLRAPVDIQYGGLKFRVYPWDNTVEYEILFGSRRRDWPEIRQLRAYVGDGGLFLDMGADIGY